MLGASASTFRSHGTDNYSEPLFEINRNLALGFPYIMSIILFASALSFVLIGPTIAGLLQALPSIAGGSMFLYGTAKQWKIGVKRVRFYDDNVLFSDIAGTTNFQYPSIEKVEKSEPHSFWTPQTQIRAYVKGEPNPVTFPGNPYSTNLDTDLYTWLSDKVKSRTTR